MQDLNELFLHFLQDVYYAERQALKAYAKLAKAALSAELKQALQQHREETQHQIERLQQVFEHLGKRARGVTCEAMNGLIEEGQELLEETGQAGPARDAGIVACAQAMEHYEIARYGTMLAWARCLGRQEVATLLEQTLAEERNCDQTLSQIATRTLNQQARAA